MNKWWRKINYKFAKHEELAERERERKRERERGRERESVCAILCGRSCVVNLSCVCVCVRVCVCVCLLTLSRLLLLWFYVLCGQVILCVYVCFDCE